MKKLPTVSNKKKDGGSSKKRHSQDSNIPSSLVLNLEECKPNLAGTRILFMVDSISGMDGSKMKQDMNFPIDVMIRISLGDEVLGLSQVYTISNKESHKVDYHQLIELPPVTLEHFASQPLNVTLLKGVGFRDKSMSQSKKSVKSAKVTMTRSNKTTKSSSIDNVLMDASIDLLPLLLGEMELEERVGDMLEVQVRLDGVKPCVPHNLLYTTMINMFNPPPEILTTDTLGCTLNIDMMPSTMFDVDTVQQLAWTKLKFGQGILTSPEMNNDVVTKKWFSAGSGPPTLSQYRNITGEDKLKDPLKIIATYDSKRSPVYMSWNQLVRSFLNEQQQESLINSLVRRSDWVVDVIVKKGTHEKKHGKKAVHEHVEEQLEDIPLYYAKMDMSELLHPGVNCTRVVGKLEKYADSPFGIEMSFPELMPPSTKSYMTQEEEDMGIDGVLRMGGAVPGRPAYLIMQVELYKSFRPRRSPEQLLLNVEDCIFKRLGVDKERGQEIKESSKDLKSEQAAEPLRRAFADTIHLLEEQYQEQSAMKERAIELPAEEDIFMEELKKSGTLALIKERLQTAMLNYLKETKSDSQLDLSEIYCKLIEEAEDVLEEEGKVKSPGPVIRASDVELIIAARFEAEDGRFDQADNFLLKRLYYYGERNADYWLDMAVIKLRNGEKAKVLQCILKAISIQPRHRDALLMYGIMMALDGDYETASLMFESATSFYPRFFSGWFIYHCFCEMTENQQGSDVALSLGQICLRDKKREDGMLKPCFWSTDMTTQEDDGFILTTIYLLSLGLLRFAEMCLSHHKQECGHETMAYLYYLAVAHHLQGKFNESNVHLKQALSISWNDERLWNLLGHNLYRLGEMERAADCYAFSIDNPAPPSEYALSFYRLGMILMQKGQYDQSSKYFLRSVCLMTSLQAWTALAKASYLKEGLDDTEVAAREANRLDDRASIPWACLGLVNYRRCTQSSLAKHCLVIAIQCGLDDEDLIKDVKEVLYTFGDDKDLVSISMGDLLIPLSERAEQSIDPLALPRECQSHSVCTQYSGSQTQY